MPNKKEPWSYTNDKEEMKKTSKSDERTPTEYDRNNMQYSQKRILKLRFMENLKRKMQDKQQYIEQLKHLESEMTVTNNRKIGMVYSIDNTLSWIEKIKFSNNVNWSSIIPDFETKINQIRKQPMTNEEQKEIDNDNDKIKRKTEEMERNAGKHHRLILEIESLKLDIETKKLTVNIHRLDVEKQQIGIRIRNIEEYVQTFYQGNKELINNMNGLPKRKWNIMNEMLEKAKHELL